MKNICVIPIFLYDLELNFIIGISYSEELQIWWFFFLKFSKILIFQLMPFVCMLITISWIFLYCLFSST